MLSSYVLSEIQELGATTTRKQSSDVTYDTKKPRLNEMEMSIRKGYSTYKSYNLVNLHKFDALNL